MDDLRRQLEETREQIFVLAAQGGEVNAFRKLVEIYEPRLLYFVRRLFGDVDGSLDILQETWLAVFRRLGTLESAAAFRVWLYRIARDKAVDALRRSHRQRELLTELQDDVVSENSWDESEPTFAAEDAEVLHQALARLSTPHREVLALRFLEEMSMEEVSLVVGCSIGTVKSRLHHARRQMRQILGDKSHA
jgi:RNA polymerase sigma-70 factor (ECF subfamily)